MLSGPRAPQSHHLTLHLPHADLHISDSLCCLRETPDIVATTGRVRSPVNAGHKHLLLARD